MTQRYDTYKDSGVQWLGEIPGHWEMSKISSHFRQRNEKVSDKDYPALSVSKQGVTPQLDNVALSNAEGTSRKLVKVGDYAVNSRSDRKGSCGVSKYEGSVSLITIVLEPFNIKGEYVHYLFRSNPWVEEFYRNGRGIVADLWTTNYQMMKSMYMPVPPLSEQRSIVSFLDAKCGKIDEWVTKKQKEVEHLQELKQRVIADAVTRGLNPHVKMKATNIPWLKEIPEHWENKRLAAMFTDDIETNKDFQYKRAFKFNYGCLVPKNEIGDPEEYRDVYVKYSILNTGDILINGLNLNYDFISQRVACAPSDGIITSAYVVCRPRPNVNYDYYTYLFKAMDSMKLFHGMGTGIRLTLSFKELKKQILPVPPIEEQLAIVMFINDKTSKIDKLIANITKEIDCIKEYKQRLISDVVTGQIKVC